MGPPKKYRITAAQKQELIDMGVDPAEISAKTETINLAAERLNAGDDELAPNLRHVTRQDVGDNAVLGLSGATIGLSNLNPSLRERAKQARERLGPGLSIMAEGTGALATSLPLRAAGAALQATRAPKIVKGAVNALSGNMKMERAVRGGKALKGVAWWKNELANAGRATRNIGRAAASGAVPGAIYGGASADPGERVAGALKGGAFGGAIGGGIGLLSETVQFASEVFRKLKPMGDADAYDAAIGELADEAARSNKSPEWLEQEISKLNPDDFVADAMTPRNVEARLQHAMRDPSDEVQKATNTLIDETTARAERSQGGIKAAYAKRAGVNPSEPPVAQRAQLASDRAKLANETYTEAYERGGTVKPSKAMEDLFNTPDPARTSPRHPVVQEILDRATSETQRKSGRLMNPSEPTPIQWFDEVRRAAKAIGEKEPAARNFVKDLDQIMASDPQFDELVAARTITSQDFAKEKASQLGQRAVRSRDFREAEYDVEQLLQRGDIGEDPQIVDAVKDAYRGGAAREVMGMPEQRLLDAIDTPEKWEALLQGLPDSEKAPFQQEVMRRLFDVAQAKKFQGAASGGGKWVEDFDALGRMTPWSLAQALKGSPGLAIAQALGSSQHWMTKGNRSRINQKMLEIATDRAGSTKAKVAAKGIAARMRQGPQTTQVQRPRTDLLLPGLSVLSRTRGSNQ
jgi:hypothetical protein